MEKNIKQKVLSENGITLITLIITIVIMLIIAGITVSTGLESLDYTRLSGFYMQLETIQKRVDDIASTNEKYENNSGTQIDLKKAGGRPIASSQLASLQIVLSNVGMDPGKAGEFRYFTISDLEEQLDLIEMDYNVFIHFDTRTIIAENGININGKTYYMLESETYYTNEDTIKNKGTIKLSYNIDKHGNNNYKVTVIPSPVGDLNTNGRLRYKKTTTKYWETADGLEIVINELTEYNIEYTDSNENVIIEKITISLDGDENPIITVN